MSVGIKEKFSLGSRGSRYYLGIAIALITVIPFLALFYLFFVAPRLGETAVGRGPVVVVMLVVNVGLGYVLLSWYPRNIVRLRRYLEDMIEGRMPEKVVLVSGMDDINTIETYMNLLIEQLSRRVSTMEDEVEERRRAEKLKDDFVSTVSHELRTPLAITKEGISLVLDGIAGETTEKQEQILGRARVSIDRLARIIDDLLDISKIEAGRMDIRRQKVDLRQLIDTAVSGIKSLADQKDLGLEARMPDGDLSIFADEDRIMQVLTNLLGNSVRYTESGGITVSAVVAGDTVECSVKDTGIGVAREDIPNLFNKFTQFSRKNGAGLKGTGLGLAIVKNILELHGGTIRADSQPGEGTTMTFALPRFEEKSSVEFEMEERMTRASEAQEGMGVLLFRADGHAALETDSSPDENASPWEEGMTRLRECMRGSDFVGTDDQGDLVILVDSCEEDDLGQVLLRWAGEIRQLPDAVGITVPGALNGGQSLYPRDGQDVGELLEAARRRMVSVEELMVESEDPQKGEQ
ncbi:MAG: hypothetical protein HQ559_07830 [Lentisphaerae bacterium]|nr:hypothetical protein [Lentisphaerota bacterium]